MTIVGCNNYRENVQLMVKVAKNVVKITIMHTVVKVKEHQGK